MGGALLYGNSVFKRRKKEEGGEKICVGDVEEGRSVDAEVSVETLHPFSPSFLLLVGILYQERERDKEKENRKQKGVFIYKNRAR